MTVDPILTQRRLPVPSTGTGAVLESPFRDADACRLFRIGRLDADVMSVSLAILAGRQPVLFDAVVGEAEAFDAAKSALGAEPEPFCETCGGHAGIFWMLGLEWHHYMPASAGSGRGDVYDPGHAPVIGWRVPAAT